jgi:hypothetical protein
MAENDKKFDVATVLKANGASDTEDGVNRISQAGGGFALDTAIGDNFFGINHRQTPNAVPINKDGHGLTFFTKPRMNMQADNLRMNRLMLPLLSNNETSLQRVIRCTLDPDLMKDGLACPFVDSDMAFIPVLTNNLLSISGFPDVEVDTFTSVQGAYKESWFMVDSVAQNLSTYDITANFRNIDGDPITALSFFWAHYASFVYQGLLVPKPDMIIENEIDYLTRIYRLVLDKNKRFVQKIGACGAAVPLNSPIGAAMAYDSTTPFNHSNDQLSLTFRCVGAIYQDTYLFYTFNKTVAMFNPEMVGSNFSAKLKKQSTTPGIPPEYEYRHPRYTMVPMEALDLFNNKGYPRIAPETGELQWWVPNELYQQRVTIYNQQKLG